MIFIRENLNSYSRKIASMHTQQNFPKTASDEKTFINHTQSFRYLPLPDASIDFGAHKNARNHNEKLNEKRRSTIPDELYKAVFNGNIQLVQEHFTPNQGIDTAYLLCMAIERNHPVEFISDFIQRTQVNVNISGLDGTLPIYAAARRGNLALLQLLIDSGAAHRAQGIKNKTILHAIASAVITPELLNYLINQLGYNINELDYDQSTLLHHVVFFDNAEGCKEVLKFNPNLSIQNIKKQTPLELPYIRPRGGINEERIKINKLLIQYKETQNIKQTISKTVPDPSSKLLNLARLKISIADIPDIKRALTEAKINIEKLDLSGNNDLDDNCVNSLKNLLKDFNKLIQIDLSGTSISSDKIADIQKSISPKERLQSLLQNYTSHEAGEKATEIIKYYIIQEPQAMQVRQEGWLLIHFNAYHGNLSILQFLQLKHANLSLQTDSGENLLHLALMNKQVEVAKWLILSVTGLIIPQPDGCHPLFLAIKHKLSDIVLILLQNNIDPNSIKANEPLLIIAARNGDEKTIAHLLKYGAELSKILFETIQRELSSNTSIKEKIIPLLQSYLHNVKRCFDFIATNQPKKLQDFLINQNINLKSLDERGQTMLCAALDQKHLECVAILMAEGTELGEDEKPVYNILKDDEKKQLRNFLLKYFTRPSDALINYFVSRSRFTGRNRRQLEEQLNIGKIFQNFFSIDESLKSILFLF